MPDKQDKPKRKVFELAEFKLDSEGEGSGTFEAVFATLDEIDRDGDTYDPGAFGNQKVKISQYNHGSWGEGASALPIGVGEISERDNKGIVRGEFDMDDKDAVKTYHKLKYFNEKGHGAEWSFALPDTEWRTEEIDGRHVRVYTSITVPEVSPVLMGAGVDTELLSIKSGKEEDETKNQDNQSKQFIVQLDETVLAVEQLVDRAAEISALRHDERKAVGRRSMRRMKILSEAMHDAVAKLDELLIDPRKANDELKALAQKYATEEN